MMAAKPAFQRGSSNLLIPYFLCVLICLLFAPPAPAAERVVFDSIRTYVEDGQYYLDADVVIRMRQRPSEALRKGVPLYFDLKVQLIKQRNLWPDSNVRTIYKTFRLFYFELTQHYRVTETVSGESYNFRTLDEAVRKLGEIRGLHLIKAGRVRQTSKYRLVLSMSLNKSELPAPLQLQAYTTRRWRLSSEEVTWPLD